MRLVPAESLGLAALAELFNEGFSDYLLPMRLDEAALRDHVDETDIDLRASRVVVIDRPVAFALLGLRGADAWIGGMGTAPVHRRQGLGERALAGALEAASARGCRTVWLEVIDRNTAAIALYDRLGFEVVRDLIVWTLAPTRTRPSSGGRPVDERSAHAWIAAHRPSREPWQRADAVVGRLRMRGVPLCGMVVDRAGVIAGAVVYRDEEPVTVVQAAAVDAAAAADVLLATAGGERCIRFTNAPPGEPCSQALRELGANPVVRQHELRLRL